MTTATLIAAPATAAQAIDPIAARAAFFFDLEMDELRAVIPQAAPAAGVAKY